ncbi:MAG: hypothetical protein AAGE59_05980 [Cyanobacteria bacterium P01_F01_bin.86]
MLTQLDDVWPEGASARRVFPALQGPPWSPYALRQFLEVQAVPISPLIFIAFSAGCVAATAVAHYWIQQNRAVAAVIMFDGWGVPIVGPFASYRLSHDAFTHHTASLLGAGQVSFFADPAVPHQHLWSDPMHVNGQQIGCFSAPENHLETSTTALQFLVNCLKQHPQALRA